MLTRPAAEPLSDYGAGKTNRPALQSLVLGLVAIPTTFAFGLGAVLGVAAVALGIRGLRVATDGGGRTAMAVLGIVGGTLGFLMVVGYGLDQAGILP